MTLSWQEEKKKKKKKMKQTLNEQVARIKSIMGCCKGKLNEDETNCVNPESEQGQKLLDDAANVIKNDLEEIGIENSDIEYNTQDTPEIIDAKKKIGEILNPVLPNASVDDIKGMMRELKNQLRQRKQGKKVEPQPVNEQAGATVFADALAYLATIPTGVFIVIGAWLLLRLIKCQIYYTLQAMTSALCGREVNKNILVKLTQLAFLDFNNLFSTDQYLYGCFFMRD